MKNIFRTLLISFSLLSISCVSDDDYVIPNIRTAFFQEDFQTATNNTNADFVGWTNFAEEGTWLWREKTFTSSGETNGYVEFSAFNSGAAVNKVWLITPAQDLSAVDKPFVTFNVCQHHLDVDSPDNSLEVLISTDYDGTDVLGATWTSLNADNLPTMDTDWYDFLRSEINLEAYKGQTVHVAFKFIGSGTDTTLDGAFQVDEVIFFNEK